MQPKFLAKLQSKADELTSVIQSVFEPYLTVELVIYELVENRFIDGKLVRIHVPDYRFAVRRVYKDFDFYIYQALHTSIGSDRLIAMLGVGDMKAKVNQDHLRDFEYQKQRALQKASEERERMIHDVLDPILAKRTTFTI